MPTIAKLIAIARQHHVLSVAIVFNLPERLCQDRNQSRPDRNFGPHVVRNHTRELRRGLRGMRREGFSNVHVLESPDEIDGATITRTRLWNDRRDHHGPFDIIGDIHGCADELEVLLADLGYQLGEESKAYGHPAGRTAVFLGDLVDRAPLSTSPTGSRWKRLQPSPSPRTRAFASPRRARPSRSRDCDRRSRPGFPRSR